MKESSFASRRPSAFLSATLKADVAQFSSEGFTAMPGRPPPARNRGDAARRALGRARSWLGADFGRQPGGRGQRVGRPAEREVVEEVWGVWSHWKAGQQLRMGVELVVQQHTCLSKPNSSTSCVAIRVPPTTIFRPPSDHPPQRPRTAEPTSQRMRSTTGQPRPNSTDIFCVPGVLLCRLCRSQCVLHDFATE